MLCEGRGVAYQRDMSAGRVCYDETYLDKFAAYDATISEAVNAGRCAFLKKRLPLGSKVLDVGAGSGEFVRAAIAEGLAAKGFEVIPQVASRLIDDGLYADDPLEFDAITFWDVIEHMEQPGQWLGRVGTGSLVFASVPIFDDLRQIRSSRHYRPGEHLFYFTAAGFTEWMRLRGFRLLEQSGHETAAGRDSIGAFAFRRDIYIASKSCECGGEMSVDYYEPVRRPTEWFLRCRTCGAMTAPCATQAEAEAIAA